MATVKSKRATTVRSANYSHEYKAIAVLVSRDPAIEVRHVARALSIHPVMLTQWRTAHAKQGNAQLRAIAREIDRKLTVCERHERARAAYLRTLKAKRHG